MDAEPNEVLRKLEQKLRREREGRKHEYSEVLLNIRHYSNLRVAFLTLFFAALAGLAVGTFGDAFSKQPAFLRVCLKVAAFIATYAFFAIDEMISLSYDAFVSRALALERSLTYHSISSLPRPSLLFRRAVVTRLMFLFVAVFWLAILLTDEVVKVWIGALLSKS